MFWKLNKLGLTEHQIPKQRSWLVIKHSLDIFSHVRSANRCFEGVTHSSCFVNKKLERECLSLFALCLLRKEGRPAKGYVQISLEGGPTVSRKTKLYLLLAWSSSPPFTLDSAWIPKKPAFYWSKSQMSLCYYAKRLQLYQNLKSIQSLGWCVDAGLSWFDLNHVGKCIRNWERHSYLVHLSMKPYLQTDSPGKMSNTQSQALARN